MKTRKSKRPRARARSPRVRTRPAAATKDVLGGAASAPRIPRKWRRHYQRLLQLRDQMLNRRGGLAQDARDEQPTFSSHMADAGTDNYDRDFALSMLSSEQDAVYEIDQALNRIHDGTYGICEMTGKRIEAARLDAIPWARFSAGAEKELESQGRTARPRLNPRQTVATGEAPTLPEEEPEEENP